MDKNLTPITKTSLNRIISKNRKSKKSQNVNESKEILFILNYGQVHLCTINSRYDESQEKQKKVLNIKLY